MDAYLLDWVNLLLRWAHVIVAIAWIGSSFYFVFLDNSLTPPAAPDLKAKGATFDGQADLPTADGQADLPDGELWAVHGGGFYHPQKYIVAPKALPENLHWFYWESYSTWLTGFALFTVLYLFNAGSFLIDKNVHDWPPAVAIAAALGFLAAFWLVYDLICRAFGQRPGGDRIVGAGVLLFVIAASWLACQLFAGRAAFLLVGAMLATAMSANVFFWIIPGQRTVIAQMKAGQAVDPVHGQRAKQRSVHNTYFTLPVLVAMLSNHYGWLYQGRHNWAVLVLLMLAGALIRHSFVARHKALVQGQRVPWEHAVAGTLLLLGLAVWLAPSPSAGTAAAAKPLVFAELKAVIDQRCVMCHNAQLQQKNVALHTPELLKQHAQTIYQQAVVLKLMPLNNATQITEDERALIKRWFEAGAPLR
ncbi:urate hydroxylase PuuD [Aquabacterium sp.]|uniref:urate hydroxylase PuuD n=1 Tax=Aquabacterium sp. TaxID=1872578 RepID=UPI002CCD22F4|nr:urate hydroxylase PuuD [Aquabacterium sp.]HSW08394.1 urate hydroxylase PuuD [Aquabacterium sp.]